MLVGVFFNCMLFGVSFLVCLNTSVLNVLRQIMVLQVGHQRTT